MLRGLLRSNLHGPSAENNLAWTVGLHTHPLAWTVGLHTQPFKTLHHPPEHFVCSSVWAMTLLGVWLLLLSVCGWGRRSFVRGVPYDAIVIKQWGTW